MGAEEAQRILHQTPISVAGGTTEAATAHIRMVALRLKVVNRQLKEAHRRLDTLCVNLAGSEEPEPGQSQEHRDVTILRSLPPADSTVLPPLLPQPSEPLLHQDY